MSSTFYTEKEYNDLVNKYDYVTDTIGDIFQWHSNVFELMEIIP